MNPLPCVLLVDDDTTTNFLNQMLLTRLRVTDRVLVAQDGEQALRKLKEHCTAPATDCPVLILLDVNMPGMNGFEFLEAYKQLPVGREQGIVVVILTTSMHPRDMQRVEQVGAVAGFVNKPLTKEKIADILQIHFQQELPTT